MAVSKSGAKMDYWREFFRASNADIFEIIEGAIKLAATDCPKEFKSRRDRIAQTLFSCKLIECSNCNKQELAVPVDGEEHDGAAAAGGGGAGDDDERDKYKSKLTDVDGNCSKGSSKVINNSRNDDDDDDNDNDDNHHHHYSYRDAEALTDEIEEESLIFEEVMKIKETVDNSPDESTSSLCNSLRKLQLMSISVETLKESEIGKSVNVLRKHSSKDVREIAKTLIEVWKEMVDEWVDATSKIAVSDATPESINPSLLDEEEEEEGLPSPPLDDLAFLNPHSMSLELNEFFDGMDDYGNPRNSREFNKNHNNGGKPPIKNQTVSKREQQKPINGPTMVPKQTNVVKPSKPPVSNSLSATRMKPNMDRKLQNPERPALPKRPMVPQPKPRSSNEEISQDKLEATKRKLQERYQQAENAKRQRTIQVMELHDLPKQGIAPKNQNMRPGNNHNRNWAHNRC